MRPEPFQRPMHTKLSDHDGVALRPASEWNSPGSQPEAGQHHAGQGEAACDDEMGLTPLSGLVVDDEPELRRVLVDYLDRQGLQARQAEDAAAARGARCACIGRGQGQVPVDGGRADGRFTR
jgi:hypothetical protein